MQAQEVTATAARPAAAAGASAEAVPAAPAQIGRNASVRAAAQAQLSREEVLAGLTRDGGQRLPAHRVAELRRQLARVDELRVDLLLAGMGVDELDHYDDPDDVRVATTDHRLQVIATLCNAVERAMGYAPRDTQLVPVLLFLEAGEHNILAEIKTGQGKTLITALAAVAMVKTRRREVHVVTSTENLARSGPLEPDARALFAAAGVSVGYAPEAAKAGRACQITYGTASDFEAQFLHDLSGGESARVSTNKDAIWKAILRVLAALQPLLPRGWDERQPVLCRLWNRAVRLPAPASVLGSSGGAAAAAAAAGGSGGGGASQDTARQGGDRHDVQLWALVRELKHVFGPAGPEATADGAVLSRANELEVLTNKLAQRRFILIDECDHHLIDHGSGAIRASDEDPDAADIKLVATHLAREMEAFYARLPPGFPLAEAAAQRRAELRHAIGGALLGDRPVLREKWAEECETWMTNVRLHLHCCCCCCCPIVIIHVADTRTAPSPSRPLPYSIRALPTRGDRATSLCCVAPLSTGSPMRLGATACPLRRPARQGCRRRCKGCSANWST